MQNLLDSKMLIFVVSVVFLAGTGWMNIQASTTDLATIEARLDKMAEQSGGKGRWHSISERYAQQRGQNASNTSPSSICPS